MPYPSDRQVSSFSLPNTRGYGNQDAFFFDALDAFLPLVPEALEARQELLTLTLMQAEKAIRYKLPAAGTSGCTAILALRIGGDVLVANMGDSVGIVLKPREGDHLHFSVTPRHETGNKAEEALARARGAELRGKHWYHPSSRGGGLQPLRGIGDIHTDPLVLRKPEVTRHRARPIDVLLLGSDGLLSNVILTPDKKQARLSSPSGVNQHLVTLAKQVSKEAELAKSAERLVMSVARGQSEAGYRSRDDITCMLLRGDGCLACFDGHGPKGSLVAHQTSQYVRIALRQHILSAFLSSIPPEDEATDQQKERIKVTLHNLLTNKKHETYAHMLSRVKTHSKALYDHLKEEGLTLSLSLPHLSTRVINRLVQEHPDLKIELNWPTVLHVRPNLDLELIHQNSFDLAVHLSLLHDTPSRRVNTLLVNTPSEKRGWLLKALLAYEPSDAVQHLDSERLKAVFLHAHNHPDCYIPRLTGAMRLFKRRAPSDYDPRALDSSLHKATLHMALRLQVRVNKGKLEPFGGFKPAIILLTESDKASLRTYRRQLASADSHETVRNVFRHMDETIARAVDGQLGLCKALESFRKDYPISTETPSITHAATAA